MNATADPRRRSASLVLALLLLAYIFNYLDRQILGHPRRPDHRRPASHRHAVRSAQRPAVRLALFGARHPVRIPCRPDQPKPGDRRRARFLERLHGSLRHLRPRFWQLFIFRMGVGIGEAGGVAPSYALIADYFEPRRRARALAIFSLGVPIGLSLGTVDRCLYRRTRSAGARHSSRWALRASSLPRSS